MPANSSVPSFVPPSVDPEFEQRWTEWLVRGREHDREGRRRLGIAVLGALVSAVAIAYFFYMP